MKNLLCLTGMGSLMTLFLIGMKPYLLEKCGGQWYCRIWVLALLGFCFPYKLDINRLFSSVNSSFPIAIMPQRASIREPTLWEPVPQAGGSIMAGFSAEICFWTVYLIGTAAVLLYYARAYSLFWQQQRKSRRSIAKEEINACFQEVCKELGLRQAPLLYESESASFPMLLGILRPQVLLPAREFTEAELRMVFRHELFHKKRKDLLWKTAALAVHILHWFNPISLLMLHNVGEACEYACDESVTKGLEYKERQAYGYLLLGQAEKGQKMPVFLAGLAGRGRPKEVLKRRIGVILNEKKKKWAGITIAFVLGFLLGGNLFAFQPIYGNGAAAAEKVQVKNAPIQAGMTLPKEWSEEEALAFAKDGLEKLFGAEKSKLQGGADFKGNGIRENSVQPDGWFIRLDDAARGYAVWLQENGIISFRSSLPEQGTFPAVSAEMILQKQELESEKWFALAEKTLREDWGEQGTIASMAFMEQNPASKRIQPIPMIRILATLADGTAYELFYYPYDLILQEDALLWEFSYFPKA